MKIIRSNVQTIKKGDEIISINEKQVEDILDFEFCKNEDMQVIEVLRDGEKKLIEVEGELPPGSLIFDNSVKKVKTCSNNCIFCFIDQLPKGLRDTLYLKDDDYRLSLLYGNFITLNNLSRQDLNKIITYNISPLYASLHSTIKKVREKIFKKNEDGLENFNYLSKQGIKFHVQLVIVPSVNDGKYLTETLKELIQNKNVLSVGIVPAARTKYTKESFKRFDSSLANEIYALASKLNYKNIYLADEFFLLADIALPPESYYGNFDQLENGIGISRLFLDGFEEYATDKEFSIVTGRLSEKVLKSALKNCQNAKIYSASNSIFGDEVTVTGLLSGRDVVREVRDKKGLIFIPDIMLNNDGQFLDNLMIKDIQDNTKAQVIEVKSTGREFREVLEKL